MTNLRVNPNSGLQSSMGLTVLWDDLNAGSLATAGSWYEYVTIKNLATGLTLGTATVAYDATASGNGSIGAGESRSRQYAFTLPDERGVWARFSSR